MKNIFLSDATAITEEEITGFWTGNNSRKEGAVTECRPDTPQWRSICWYSLERIEE
jgi:hypothetical protein